ncbi:MMPL family transporter [Lacinutrix sp. C3R15]|uniref:1-acyl-sn-glycerol-3-phosphate acyltransferase n=1 Tax=Flavobacteriaceae TaxID=49546 RepID=UPI001C0A16D8|nr:MULTISPECIES: 1-acyl-sn-glycerol-3-phosphate acyltransferase [Flavobacteriaceae]MBU2938191.1 MMPL family transporter [Lacinutrix sp. C3R15]MDO6621505.1 MMPL family transporter [Oceanihabitans sp. 1_MG-2023]
MDKLFYNIYLRIAAQKLWSIGILFAGIIGLFFLASNVEFEEDITKLIPQSEKSSEAQKVLKQVNFADKIIVNIQRKENGNIEDLTQYATQFIDSISSSSKAFIKDIQGQVADEDVMNTLNFVYNNLPLFLDQNDYKTIQQKLHKDSIENQTKANYKTLISPSGFIAKETILKDPLGLSFIALKKLQELSFGDDFTLHNGFIVSKDKNNVLLFITPTFASSETAENASFADNLYALQAKLNATFNGKVVADYFGGALIAVANAKQIKRDIQLTVGIAVTVLLLILILFYKKLSVPIILFTPTVLGALLAVSLLYLIRGKISAISLGIGSVLLGVTLDYALHILTHIRSNNNIKQLYTEITKPILMSSLTTALAFLCLLFIESQALQDLGIFAAISVLGASVFALLFIPQVYNTKVENATKKNIIDRVAAYPLHKNKWSLIVLVILLSISAFTYNKVTFNNDLAKLNFEPKALVDAQQRLDALTNISSKSVYLATYGNTENEALQANDAIYPMLKKLQKDDKIIQFSSIGSLIQSEEMQLQKINNWKLFWSPENIQNTTQNLIESGNTLGFKPSTFKNFYALLKTNFNPLTVADFKALKTISSDDYITTKDRFSTVTTLVKVQEENTQNLIDTFKNQEKTVVVDRKHMNETFLGNLKNDFNRLVLYSSIVVLLLLFLFYKSTSLTLVTAIPIALTWLLTIGTMGLFSIEFNIFNIIISTFIFGLGIDYCIFITNGLLHEYKTGEEALPTHKTSIILSVITTILGVGVLIFAKHPALHSISLVSIIGILSALFISFSIQPLLFRLFIGSKTKRPISLRLFLHSVLSFGYYGLGGFLLSLISVVLIPIIPISKKLKMSRFHKVLSTFMKSVLYTNPFVKKSIINASQEDFKKQAVIISNHTSFLDILAIGMLHPKIIFLVNDWVYNSPVFGKAVKLAGFYPVSNGIDNGLSHLQTKVDQGYSLMAFPEGTRSNTNKIKRFHKGAFYLAEQFNLDIIPVLIHGNSEVLPKGSFIIKNGSITLKVLDRITTKNTNFGTNSRERTKAISTHFKNEFNKLRDEIEDETYFHRMVLEDYRYKGDALYKKVKADVKTNAKTYKTILDFVDEKASIVHLSKDSGQLDFLLALDRPDRKLYTYIADKEESIIVTNSYIVNTHYKIFVSNTVDKTLENKANVAIISLENLSEKQIKNIANTANLFILLKDSRNLYTDILKSIGFKVAIENKTLIILKK